jgi:predicted RNA binding protein YcfA (HicA-like mRNA interferase family)
LPSVWWYDGVKYILENKCVPPKIRELISMLESAGFENTGGKGSHRNFKHSQSSTLVTVSGQLGDDAKHYLIKAVKIALENSRNENN